MNDLFDTPEQQALREQIACVRREVRLREMVYPRHVADGKLGAASAMRELEQMKAVLATLKRLAGEA